MEPLEAFVRAVKMYVVIGLVVTALHAVAVVAPQGDTRWQRTVTVFWDIVWWPRFLVGAGRIAEAGRDDRQQLRASALSDPHASAGAAPPVSSAMHEACVPPLRPVGTAAVGLEERGCGTYDPITRYQPRAAMSLAQRVKEAPDRQGVPEATVDRDGYRVEAMMGDLAIVRWGRGEPLQGTRVTRNGPTLMSCMTALKRERFLVAPNEFEDAAGLFIAVRESSP